MNDQSSDEWKEFLEIIEENSRQHAGYFSWESDRALEEKGVVQALSESLASKGVLFFNEYTSRNLGEDPPDCEAKGKSGDSIGIEVTELVEGQSIANARQNKLIEMEPWSTSKIDDEITQRIKRKDTPKKVKGGPYEQYVLIIFSDEPAILDYDLIEHIRNNNYGDTSLITRAFFLMSYSPWEKCCPYIELRINNA